MNERSNQSVAGSLATEDDKGYTEMAVKFLTEEWASAVNDSLNNHEGFKTAIGTSELALQFETKDGPAGDVSYYLDADGGSVAFALGSLDDADVTVSQGYDTAVGISQGKINVQTAFMTGKLKVQGNLAKLMMHTSAVAQWQAANKELDVEY